MRPPPILLEEEEEDVGAIVEAKKSASPHAEWHVAKVLKRKPLLVRFTEWPEKGGTLLIRDKSCIRKKRKTAAVAGKAQAHSTPRGAPPESPSPCPRHSRKNRRHEHDAHHSGSVATADEAAAATTLCSLGCSRARAPECALLHLHDCQAKLAEFQRAVAEFAACVESLAM